MASIGGLNWKASLWHIGVRPDREAAPMLIVADRPILRSYIDNAPVSFKFYALKQTTDELAGE